MKKFIAASLIALSSIASFNAMAIVNNWTESYQQGTLEFYTENSDGFSLAFSCRDTGDQWPVQALFLNGTNGNSLSSDDDRYALVIEMGGQKYQMISPVSTVGASNWRLFFEGVKKTKAKTVKVYVQDHPETFVVFSTNGLKKIVTENKGGNCFYLG